MNNACKAISKAEAFLNTGDNRDKKNNFLEKYTKCEVLVRPIVRKYLKNIGKDTPDNDMDLNLRNIKSALEKEGCAFSDPDLLGRIWSTNGTVGKSSCRFLRNKITHNLMYRALKEVVERSDELNLDMDTFIETLTANSR